ncbi:4Fe-4S domain-containing protein [Aerosakkonema sp. BLCC-F183]|uniref:4Fe-4S domain-containing protein n=1 Tax=Aerosakkonema sp. BLCC-F183 TaxID=3342834 RepID=UPI0035BA19C8
MAHLNQRRPENISGDFYVDNSCIDCDTCRWMAPEVFASVGEQSAVYHQPANEEERLRSLQALLSCPTASIGTIENPKDIKEAQETFPILVDENVYHCGYHSEDVPGHTKGHTVLLYKNKYLFSGDHLAWSPEINQLIAFRSVCWYSWTAQLKSMKKLANYTFEWVLPGHGRRYRADTETVRQQMQNCIAWMERN